jgi:hypothetical protein
MSKLKTLALAASLSLTAAFTLSCSSDSEEGSGGGSGPMASAYPITEMEPGYLSWKETYTYYECTEAGLREEIETYTEYLEYSINNKVLTAHSWYDIKFNGTTDNIIGTWTRNKNKAASCRDEYDEWDDEYYYWCDHGYDITKLEITNQTVKVTQDICLTDEIKDGEDLYRNGYLAKVIDCNSVNVSKDGKTIKISVKILGNDNYEETWTYNGKSCKRSRTESDSKAACNKAIAECQGDSYSYCIEDAYYNYRYQSYYICLEENMPSDFSLWEGSDDSSSDNELGKSLAKPQARNFLNLPNAKSKRF